MSVPETIARLRAAGCVFAEDEAALLCAAADGAELDALIARRVAGEPLEHLLGWAEFCGLRIAVAPGVFVPRRRTELVAREAIAAARPGAIVVELCCGAGAVAAAVRAAVPDAVIVAAELDPAAADCARRNLPGADVLVGDLYEPLPPSLHHCVDVLIANAPYVPTGAIGLMPPEAREHEPQLALDGGTDGLAVLRRVIADAPGWLAPAGTLVVEASRAQAPAVASAMAGAGLPARIVHDESLDGTAIVGRAAPHP